MPMPMHCPGITEITMSEFREFVSKFHATVCEEISVPPVLVYGKGQVQRVPQDESPPPFFSQDLPPRLKKGCNTKPKKASV